ncbi:radical SAM protein [Photorhabdus sp. RM323S]|uniref:radical SAM protein n=1 Tax=Photorhabdus sp. RM323S TaxID=3342828 RepID=UPI0036DE57F4
MPTFRCNAECSNCGTFSSPRVNNTLSLDEIIYAINEARRLNFLNVVFTGGEPTLRWRDLVKAIEYATSLGLHTRLVTNAHWAKSKSIALSKLRILIDSGLKEINFSTGDEHIKFIPMSNIINAVNSAYENKIVFHVNIEGGLEKLISKENFVNSVNLSHISREELKLRFEESPWMPLSPDDKANYKKNWYISKENIASCTGCNSVLQTIVIQGDGNIGVCCGLGLNRIKELNFGKISEVNSIKTVIDKAEQDLLILLLHFMGPEKILAWCADYNDEIKWENMYAHRCQACKRIFTDQHVAQVLIERIDELIPELIASVAIDEAAWPHYVNNV